MIKTQKQQQQAANKNRRKNYNIRFKEATSIHVDWIDFYCVYFDCFSLDLNKCFIVIALLYMWNLHKRLQQQQQYTRKIVKERNKQTIRNTFTMDL